MIAHAERRIVSNTLVQIAPPAFRAVIGVFLTIALTRYLGVTKFGAYALAFAYVALINGIFANWGLSTVCLREISRHPDERPIWISSAALLQLLIAIAAYLVLWAGIFLLHYPSSVEYAIALYGLTVFFTPLDIVALPFQAEFRLHRTVPPSLIGVILHFLFTMAVIGLHGPLISLIGAALAALIVQWLWMMILARPWLITRPHPLYLHWKMLAREAWPIGTVATISSFMQQAPALVLSHFGLEAVGIFSAANKIPQILIVLPLMINTSAFPLLSHMAHTSDKAFHRLIDHLLGTIILVAVPLSIFLFGFSTLIVRVIFGPNFANAAVPLGLLGASLAVSMPALIIGEATIAAGKQRLNLVSQLTSIPFMALMLFIFVPTHHVPGISLAMEASHHTTGAAIALVMTNSWVLLTTLLLSRSVLGKIIPLRPLVSGALGAAAGGFLLVTLSPLGPEKSATLATLAAAVVIGVLQWHTLIRLTQLATNTLRHSRVGDRRNQGRADDNAAN
jgi:O-antigen/teichoic acid export membrane protein